MDLLNLLSNDMLLLTFENVNIGNILGIYNSNIKLRSIVNYLLSRNKIKFYRVFGLGQGRNNVFGDGNTRGHFVNPPIEINVPFDVKDIYIDMNRNITSQFLTMNNDLLISNKDRDMSIFNIEDTEGNPLKIVRYTGDFHDNYKYYLTDEGQIYFTGFTGGGIAGIKDHDKIITTPIKIHFDDADDVEIVKFITYNFKTLFLTKDGNVYVLGKDLHKSLGIGNITDNIIDTPLKLEILDENNNQIVVIDINMTNQKSLLLTNNGDVYIAGKSFGINPNDGYFHKMELLDENNNSMFITYISVKAFNIIFINDRGEVYYFGYNPNNRVYSKVLTKFDILDSNGEILKIKQVSGFLRYLFLTEEGEVYITGEISTMGLGADINVPEKLPIIDDDGKEVKVIKIQLYASSALFLTE